MGCGISAVAVMIFATRRAPWAHCVAQLSHCIKPVCAQNGALIDPLFTVILIILLAL